jgi:hypothetical protein
MTADKTPAPTKPQQPIPETKGWVELEISTGPIVITLTGGDRK